jgi:thioesterase domain-containing protein
VFLDRFKAAGLVPENTGVADFQGFLELMLTHNRITSSYSPAIYPGKILVFRAEDVPAYDTTQSAASIDTNRAPDLGWQKYSSQPVEIISVPGDHISMITAPNVQSLAEKLARQIFLERRKNDDKNTLGKSG